MDFRKRDSSERAASYAAFSRDFICAGLSDRSKTPKIRYIANCVTANDKNDVRVGKESRCNCLFLGRPIRGRRRPVEEAVTSELF